MTACAVVVVGHVDHGKTALVRAITGQETDRLAEEKARGRSITLGFAYRDYGDRVVDFIDSPGHEDLIRAMVCGASGAQAALVVISAVDGVERQTREHLEILRHLNVNCGVVALTKADLVPPEDRSIVKELVAEMLAGSPFLDEAHLFCSASTGEGLDALNATLQRLVDRAPAPAPLPGAFLPVDRVFTVKGVGTVATGTLLGAPLAVMDDAMVLPGLAPVTVRRLQSRSADLDEVQPGMRTAVNLRGLALEAIGRGDVIATGGAGEAASEIDGWVAMSPGRRPLKHGEAVRVLIGTASEVATAYIWGPSKTLDGEGGGQAQLDEENQGAEAAGHGGYVRLRLHAPMATHAGQRGIVRRLSPAETLGGFIVLDPAAPTRRWRDRSRPGVLAAARSGEPTQLAAALAASHGGVASLADLRRLGGLASANTGPALTGFSPIDGGYVAAEAALAAAREAVLEAVADGLAADAARTAVPVQEIVDRLSPRFAGPLLTHVLEGLLAAGALLGDQNAVAPADHDPFAGLGEDQRRRIAEIEQALRDGGMSPPSPALFEADRALVTLLVDAGRALALHNVGLKQVLIFHAGAIADAHRALLAAFPPPEPFTMAEARAALETTRKFAIPVLEHMDKVGLTRRRGDVRQLVVPAN